MNTRKLYSLKDMLCRELDNIADKGEMSAGDLETAHKLTDTIKNVDKISMLEGHSGDDRGRSYGHYGNSYGYDGDMRHDDNYSGRRTYVRGYYRDGLKDKLQDLIEEAGTDKERKAIQRAIDSME